MIYVTLILSGSLIATSTALSTFYRTQTTTTGAPNENVAFYKQRGSSVLAASLVSAKSTFVYYTGSTGGQQAVTSTSTLQTPDAATAGFGTDTTFGRDHITGNMLFVSEVDSGAVNNGKVVFYNGQYSAWSVQQILRPPTEFFEQGFFGSSMDLDRYHLRTLAVGCKGCNSTHATSGSVYVYEATSPDARRWTQMAELGTSLSSMGANYAEIDRDVIVTDAVNGAVTEAVVFARDPKGRQWSLRQVLVPRSTTGVSLSVTAMDVFDETIIAGASSDSSFSSNHGSVSIFYADTERFHLVTPNPKAKPSPTQWSLRQVLYAPTPTASNAFGAKVSIDGDRLVVADGGGANNYFYVYERDWTWNEAASAFSSSRTYAMWSFQQRLGNAALITDMQLRGSSLAVVDGTNLNIYDETKHWDCLLVSVEDHFSDGWDTAALVVDTPDGDKDVFSHRCDMANPYQFRYCPASVGDEGLYRFSIPNGKEAKFHWELLWRVFDEATGTWYTGNWDTKIDFEWSRGYTKFIQRKVDRDLPNNITCKACKTRPTEKPAPRQRHLKSKDNTHAPTVSPAPTIVTSVDIHPWQELHLMSAGSVDWFDSQHKGTSYYISDKGGHRLLSVGTMCPWETTLNYKTCWEDYPDGDYILRVGGGVDRISSHTYKFCNSQNALPAQSQMFFRISNGECSILSFAKSSTYCKNDLGIMQAGIVGISILGVSTTGTGGSLSNTEKSIVEQAVASIIEARVSDVHVISTSVEGAQALHVEIEFAVMDSEKQLNFMDPDVVTSFEQTVVSQLSMRANDIWAAIVSGETYTSLQTATKVDISGVRLTGGYESLRDRSSSSIVNPMVQDITDVTSNDAHVNQGNTLSVYTVAASVGWVFGLIGVVAVAAFVAFPHIKDLVTSVATSTDAVVVGDDDDVTPCPEGGLTEADVRDAEALPMQVRDTHTI